MNLFTSYLGLPLPHPFIAGASPLGYHLDTIRRVEDAGAAAIVLHSLFEEQVTLATEGRVRHRDPFDRLDLVGLVPVVHRAVLLVGAGPARPSGPAWSGRARAAGVERPCGAGSSAAARDRTADRVSRR